MAVCPGVTYEMTFEILRNDLGGDNEYVEAVYVYESSPRRQLAAACKIVGVPGQPGNPGNTEAGAPRKSL